MNVEKLGDKLIDQPVDLLELVKLVSSFSDIYRLDEKKLSQMRLSGRAKSLSITLWKVLSAQKTQLSHDLFTVWAFAL